MISKKPARGKDIASDPVRLLMDAAEEVRQLKDRIDRAQEAEHGLVLRDPSVARSRRASRRTK